MTSGAVPRGRVAAMVAFGCQGFVFISYVGGLLGAVLTGVVGADNLRFGFAVPLVLILLVWPLARHFETPARARAPVQTGTSAQ